MSERNERSLCRRLAALLEGVAELKAAKIVVEDEADVGAEVQRASTGVVVVVACTGHESGEGRSDPGQYDVEILCTEKPRVNRAGGRRDFLSAADAAEIVAGALDRVKVDEFGTVRYEARRRQDEDDRVQSLVTLTVMQSETLCWGLDDGLQAYGDIKTKRTGRGGTPIFETGRDGRARYVGVADPHVTVDLTADVTSDADEFPAIGDFFSCPADGVQTTFRCTVSELSESVTAGKTIHLAGRTVGA